MTVSGSTAGWPSWPKAVTGETAVLYRDNDSALPSIDLLERAGTPYRCRQVESAFSPAGWSGTSRM